MVNKKMEKRNQTDVNTGSKIAAAVIIFLIIFRLVSCSSDGNYTDEELEKAGKWRACWNRSNTYYKCDWSHRENRCVCKQR